MPKIFTSSGQTAIGKIGPHSNEDVILGLKLIKFKCIPLLVYSRLKRDVRCVLTSKIEKYDNMYDVSLT
jgi:hypothetical protein